MSFDQNFQRSSRELTCDPHCDHFTPQKTIAKIEFVEIHIKTKVIFEKNVNSTGKRRRW